MSAVPALSIMQPWAGLIALGLKPVENRTWITRYRGPVLIHAGLSEDEDAWAVLHAGYHPATYLDKLGNEAMAACRAGKEAGAFKTGGIVGEARLVDCVSRSDSDWFVGPYGFVMADARLTPFRPCRGALGLFAPDFDSRYAPRRPAGRRTAA